MTATAINKVKQTEFTLDELSKRADPDWTRDRNYQPAYQFSNGRTFIDHRDNVYEASE